MKVVRLRRMHIENFKGIPLFDIAFNDVTNIVGRNGAGKTSLHDAYLWTLTGEDSNENSNFKVQPLGEDGTIVPKLTTKVEVTVEINGEDHSFTRVLEQTWSMSKLSGKEEQGPNASSYYIDGLPKKYTEYRDFVKVLFCDIENFKLVSSLTAFCNLDTKLRRKKLLEMAGEMPDILTEAAYPHLYPLYSVSKDIDGIKAKMNFDKKKLEAEQSGIPDKLTENERNRPVGIDFIALKASKAKIEKEIAKIDGVLRRNATSRKEMFSEIESIKKEIFDKEVELTELDGQFNRELLKKKSEIETACLNLDKVKTKQEINQSRLTFSKTSLEAELTSLKEEKSKLYDEWKAKNSETFNPEVGDTCPTCGRKFSDEQLSTMRNELVKSFNSGKTAILKRISELGNEVNRKLADVCSKIDATDKELEETQAAIKKIDKDRAALSRSIESLPTIDILRSHSDEYQNISNQIARMNEKLSEKYDGDTTPADDEIEAKKKDLQAMLNSVTLELGKEYMIEKVDSRKEELQALDKELTEKIAECNAVLYEIKEYERAHIAVVESKVSSMFKIVKWKMYEKNLTNDGEKEICECIVDGIPYSTNLNTAKVVNAGIDIVNAISKWLGIVVPIWVDGKESVSKLIDTDSQLITLSVVEGAELQVV